MPGAPLPLLIPPIPPPPPPPQVAQSGAGSNNTTRNSAATREICSLMTLTPILLIKFRHKVGTLIHRLSPAKYCEEPIWSAAAPLPLFPTTRTSPYLARLNKLRNRALVFASVRCAFGVKRRTFPALYDSRCRQPSPDWRIASIPDNSLKCYIGARPTSSPNSLQNYAVAKTAI